MICLVCVPSTIVAWTKESSDWSGAPANAESPTDMVNGKNLSVVKPRALSSRGHGHQPVQPPSGKSSVQPPRPERKHPQCVPTWPVPRVDPTLGLASHSLVSLEIDPAQLVFK